MLADASRQYQALLEVSQSVASHRDLTALFQDLVERLPRVLSFDSLWLVLHDPARNRMRLHVLEGPARAAAERSEWPLERPKEEAQRSGVEHAGAASGARLGGRSALPQGIRLLLVWSCCIPPLTTAHRRLGPVGLGMPGRTTNPKRRRRRGQCATRGGLQIAGRIGRGTRTAKRVCNMSPDGPRSTGKALRHRHL